MPRRNKKPRRDQSSKRARRVDHRLGGAPGAYLTPPKGGIKRRRKGGR